MQITEHTETREKEVNSRYLLWNLFLEHAISTQQKCVNERVCETKTK